CGDGGNRGRPPVSGEHEDERDHPRDRGDRSSPVHLRREHAHAPPYVISGVKDEPCSVEDGGTPQKAITALHRFRPWRMWITCIAWGVIGSPRAKASMPASTAAANDRKASSRPSMKTRSRSAAREPGRPDRAVREASSHAAITWRMFQRNRRSMISCMTRQKSEAAS